MRLVMNTRIAPCLVLSLILFNLFAMPAEAASPTVVPLFSFPCDTSGACPDGSFPNLLIEASDGNFYGVAQSTSINTSVPPGTIFRLTPGGQFTLLHTFSRSDTNPINPGTSLVEANDGFLYGTTFDGGPANQGILFRIRKDGTGFAIVHNFCSATSCADGLFPASLILGHDGNLYGVSSTSNGTNIFRFTPPSTFTIARSFPSSVGAPISIIQGADGNFYATAIGGDLNQVERISPKGQITVLGQIPFQGFDPCHGETPLLQVADGDLWGMMGCYQIEQAQFFRVHLAGGLTEFPQLGHTSFLVTPIQASDGNLWTIETGLDELIQASPATGTIIHSFSFTDANSSVADNAVPVVQGADGKIYGTASIGSGTDGGIVWMLDAGLPLPLAAVAAFSPTSGAVGTKVLIRGDHFIGTTTVRFNGVNAVFKVLNRNFISAVVPAGASTGAIEVSNAGGSGQSQGVFHVD